MEHSNNIVVEERPNDTQPGDVSNCLKRYENASILCKNKMVLDFSSGYGFGTNLLREKGIDVIGVEPYKEVIAKARIKFPKCNFMCKDPRDIDFSMFDIVTCMEVIEHLEEYQLNKLLETFSKNIDEVVASTPDGNFFKYKPKTKAERRGYHVCHYTYSELETMFKKYYNNVMVCGIAFDSNPKVNRYTGHFIYATGKKNGPRVK